MKTFALLSIPTVFLIITFATFAGDDNPLCQALRQGTVGEPILADLSDLDIANLARTCRRAGAAVREELGRRHYAATNTVDVDCSRQRTKFRTYEEFRQYVLKKIGSIATAEENKGRGIKLNLSYNGLGADSNFLASLINAIAGKVGQLHTILVGLDLEGNDLTELPGSIVNLVNLQVLLLGRNQLTLLPNSIGDLVDLRFLSLNDNRLTVLPDSIGRLVKLRSLWLQNNGLIVLPDSIENLANLQSLFLHGNRLTLLPNSIGRLANLEALGLSNNQLTKLPDSIGKLANLQDLELSHNQLAELPDSIGNLVKLRSLLLGGNPIQQGPNAELHLPETVAVRWQ
jgi:hypothetical protein